METPCGVHASFFQAFFMNQTDASLRFGTTNGTSATMTLTVGAKYVLAVVARCDEYCGPSTVRGQYVAVHPVYLTAGTPSSPANKPGDKGLSPGATAGVVIVVLVVVGGAIGGFFWWKKKKGSLTQVPCCCLISCAVLLLFCCSTRILCACALFCLAAQPSYVTADSTDYAQDYAKLDNM
jgi:hypothetical protein